MECKKLNELKKVLGPIENFVINSTIKSILRRSNCTEKSTETIKQEYINKIVAGTDPWDSFIELVHSSKSKSGDTYSPRDCYISTFKCSWYWFPRRIWRWFFYSVK